MKLSVIIPVFNEQASVLGVLERVGSVPLEKEIIVIDDCSRDGTRELLIKRQNEFKDFRLLLHDRNMGKGACISTALAQINGDYVIIQDADLEQDPRDFLRLLQAAEGQGYQAVFGTRILSWGHQFDIRYMANKIFALITNVLYGSRLSDIMTGYKLIKKNLFLSLNLCSKRFDIEPEITAKLLKKNISIKEVPVSYAPRMYKQGKKIRARDSFGIIHCLLKIKFSDK